MLEDALLAYLKAYRLCADKETLFLALSGCFDDNTFKKLKSALWAAVGETLTKKGLFLVRRRDSDKRSQSRADFEDVWAAFEALDGDDELPAIYCEATDLISLPSPVRSPLDPGPPLVSSVDSLAVKVAEVSAKQWRI